MTRVAQHHPTRAPNSRYLPERCAFQCAAVTKNTTLDYAVLAPTNEAFARTYKALNTTAAELADSGELLDIML